MCVVVDRLCGCGDEFGVVAGVDLESIDAPGSQVADVLTSTGLDVLVPIVVGVDGGDDVQAERAKRPASSSEARTGSFDAFALRISSMIYDFSS